MRKFTLFIASLLMTVGALAQTATTHDDGVYKIFWQWNGRGYLTYHDTDYPTSPQLAGVTLSGYQNSHYALDAEGIQLSWYLYTSKVTGKSYLFEATTGKFVTINLEQGVGNGKQCVLSTEVTAQAQLDLKATTNTEGYMLSYENYNFCSGCGSAKGNNPVRFATDGQTDGGIPFVFVAEGASITEEVKSAAIVKINQYEGNYYATPEAGKYYKIKGEGELPWLTANVTSGGNVVVSTEEADAAVFLKTENGLQAVATGKYLGYTGGKYTYSDTELGIELRNSGDYLANYTNKYAIVSAGNYMFNNNNDGIVHESDQALDLVRLWAFTEVDAPAATVNGVIYETLAAAVEVVEAGQTLTLWKDTDEAFVLPMGVILNKNGFTADNVTVAQPAKDLAGEGTEDAPYLINGVDELKLFRDKVNEGDNYAGKFVKLTADIDLADENWVGIGTETNNFKGNFNGGDYTISNLNIVETEAKEGKAYIGLFGFAKDVIINNLTIDNVNINIPCLDIDHSQGHIGAIVGSLEGTSTIENVTVKGDIKVYATQEANGASRVAVIAGGNAYGNVTMKNVHVIANEGSYLKANNNTGALAGQLQGKCTFENCSSNIDVTVNKFFAGGLIGIAAGDSKFTDCHTIGDVAVVAGRAGRGNDHYRVGGIAGGWADGKTNVCTLTKCSYTGTVSGTNADGSVAETLDYDGYVGRGYTLTNCAGSKVVIDGKEFVQAYNNVFGVYAVDGVYEIGTLAAFKAFRDAVNAGDSYAGKTVKLIADIDLADENWVGIGSATADHGFMGDFDGNGFKIKNLSINNPALDSDDYAYAGLFSITEGTDKNNQNSIKNLTIENVTINTTGHIVAAAIAYPYYTIVENVTVCGDITIKGGNYTAGALAYTRRCVNASSITVSGNEGSSITGAQVVGGVISDIQMNGGLKAEYADFSVSGISVTGTKMVGGISGIICEQTLAGVSVNNVTLTSDDSRVGIVSGSLGGVSTITDVAYGNVIGATAIVGATYDGGAAVEAKIGSTYYATLQKAVEAVQLGEEIVLLADVNEAVTIDGLEITIDLNGQKIVSDASDAVSVINYAIVTIKNGTLESAGYNCGGIYVKNATAVLEDCAFVGTNSDQSCGVYASNGADVTIDNCELTANHYGLIMMGANVTVNSGEFNASTSISANGSNAYDNATLTIHGGTFNGGIYWPANGMLTINDGTFTAATALYVKSGSLEINGGTFTGNGEYKEYMYKESGWEPTGAAIVIENVGTGEYDAITSVAINGGEFTSEYNEAIQSVKSDIAGSDIEAVIGFITGGIFSSDVYEFCADGLVCEERADGYYGIVEDLNTAIEKMKVNCGVDSVYDLFGRRVLELRKGELYIINGKKVMVK